MRFIFILKIVTLFLFAISTVFSQNEKSNSRLVLKLIPVFNNQKLIMNENEYVTHQNDTIKIAVFKKGLSFK